MSKVHTFVITLCSLVAGVALVVVGGIIGNEALITSGSGLIGVAVGAVALPRPQDADM